MAKSNSTTKELSTLVYKKLADAKKTNNSLDEILLNKLFETLFYTSMQTEEGQFIKVTVTFIDYNNPDPSPPERIVADRWKYVKFTTSIEFSVKNLIKLSKAADIWSSSLAVYCDDKGDLIIWGMIDQAIHYHSFLNYEADTGPEQPGLFQATIIGIGNIRVIMGYELVANLKQNILISNYVNVFNKGTVQQIIKKNNDTLKARIEAYRKKEFPSENSKFWQIYTDDIVKQTLIRILLRIQNYQHGGAILITDQLKKDLDLKYRINYGRLADSIERFIKLTIQHTNYSDSIHSDYLDNDVESLPMLLYLNEDVADFESEDTKNELKGAIRFVSSLSCVDGLVVLESNLKVKGFGAIIKAKDLPEFVYVSTNSIITENSLTKINPNNFGTRHRSMFSFCWNNPGSLGFVISQDGDIRAITLVNDKLIMWENIRVLQFIRNL